MDTTAGYPQLQPNYILGTDNWVEIAAEQMVGADIDRANQLREHLPFYDLARSRQVVVPRVATLGTAGFPDRMNPGSDRSVTTLREPPEQVEITSIEGAFELANFPIAVESYSIDQLELQIEFKKIAIRIAFWEQFFRPRFPNGFRGLPDLVAPWQRVAVGGELTLAVLDDLVARVTEAQGEMDRKVLVLSHRAFVDYVRLVRATGAPLTYTMHDGRRYATHNGVPLLICDFIPEVPTPEGDETDVWCMSLGHEANGVFGVVPEEVGDNGLVIERAQGASGASTAIHRVRWYCAVILGHDRGLAGLTRVRLGGAAEEDTPEQPEFTIFDNSNTGAVTSDPPTPTLISLSVPHRITYLRTYHWNDGNGALPTAEFRLRDANGEEFGPFPITTGPGSGAMNVNWMSAPNVELPAGVYEVLDSDPATWSHNLQSSGAGFATVRGRLV